MLFLLLAISLDTLSPPPSLLAPAQPPPIWMVPVNPLESPKRIGPSDSVWWQGRLYLPAKPVAPKNRAASGGTSPRWGWHSWRGHRGACTKPSRTTGLPSPASTPARRRNGGTRQSRGGTSTRVATRSAGELRCRYSLPMQSTCWCWRTTRRCLARACASASENSASGGGMWWTLGLRWWRTRLAISSPTTSYTARHERNLLYPDLLHRAWLNARPTNWCADFLASSGHCSFRSYACQVPPCALRV